MNMDILTALPGFILAFMLIFCYEYDIKLIQNKPRNRVHFYVARNKNGGLWLYLGKPLRGDTEFYTSYKVVCLANDLSRFGLKYEDFDSLKWEDEPIEVFLNIE